MNIWHRTPPTALAAAIVAVAILAGCSGGNGTATSATHPPVAAVTATSEPPSTQAGQTASSNPNAANDLSGNWTGHYGGAYDGSFQLSWKQTGSALTGTITLSDPATTLSLNGAVGQGTISFGTVGSTTITYKGDFSATTMAGTYQVNGADAGTWTASRSS